MKGSPTSDDPFYDTHPRAHEDAIEYYLQSAELHVTRVVALAETEWKISLAFWTVLLLSGVSFISYTNASTPPMTVYIAHSDILFLAPYLVSSAIFVFGFSVNQAKSIVEERTRYRYFLNQAAQLTGEPYTLPGGDPHAEIHITRDNRVWAQKLLSTFLFVSGIWLISQWLAFGKSLVDAAVAKAAPHAPDLAHLAFGPGTVACAFFDCHDRGYVRWGDWPESGTVLWLASAVAVGYFFIRAHRAGQR